MLDLVQCYVCVVILVQGRISAAAVLTKGSGARAGSQSDLDD